MKRIQEIRLPFDHGPRDLEAAVEARGVAMGSSWRILKKSLDARKKKRIVWVYTVGVPEPGDDQVEEPVQRETPDPRPVIVGAGPGGLFAALWLVRHGVRPAVLEQGDAMPERVLKMARFMRYGELDERSNLGFGAGGAGAYSDGKLLTRIKSPYIRFVMESFVDFGAPDEVRYLADPHLGSSRIRRVISAIITDLEQSGVEVRFRSKVESIDLSDSEVSGVELESGELIHTKSLLLALGHSARPLYSRLADAGVAMEFKPFAVGLRLEHPAPCIDRIQFGAHAGHPSLGAARYQLAHTWKEQAGDRDLYSFCMCPGGYVLNAATERSGVVSNGMSNPGRRGAFSNAAMVVNVGDNDVDGGHLLRGVSWQQQLESDARSAVNSAEECHALPGQRLVDFLAGKASPRLPESSCHSPVRPARLDELLPSFVVEALRTGMEVFERRMRGLISDDALLVGVESRTSAPVRILRDKKTMQSENVAGLYPIGEGAGYAGGITSAAVDGITSAQAFLETLPVKK
jgi:uncharacterized FAD-dependent dehydrogenase